MAPTSGKAGGAGALVFAGLLASACAASPSPADVEAVDVVVSAAAVASGSVAAPAATLVRAEPSASVALEEPRRVLTNPVVPALGPMLPPQTATPLGQSQQAAFAHTIGQLSGVNSPGAAADGPAMGGTFKQGDTLHLPITLQPGRCYTMVAVSKGIVELDLDVVFSPGPGGPPIGPMPLAKDTMTGPTAAVGFGAMCFKNPLPFAMPVVVVVRATSGAGSAAVQSFSK